MFKKNVELGFDFNWDKFPDDDPFKILMGRIQPVVNNNIENYAIVNGLPFYFNKKDRKFSVNFSGGADSTMLTYILASLIKEHNLQSMSEIHCITLVRFWDERSGTEDAARNVFSMLQSMFPELKMVHHIGFVPVALEFTPLRNLELTHYHGKARYFNSPNGKLDPHVLEYATSDVYAVKDYTHYLVSRHKLDRVYSGTTMNPVNLNIQESLEDSDITGPEPAFRKFREISDSDIIMNYSIENGDPITYLSKDPFNLIQKSWVMAQYKNFNLKELQDITRSCESNDFILDKIFGKGEWRSDNSKYSCGSCFFCLERQWGIDNSEKFSMEYHNE